MPETTTKTIPSDTPLRRLERWALAAVLAAVPLGFATGFSRYEVLKLALLVALGGVGLLAFLLDFCGGRAPRLLGGGLAGPVAWLFVLAAALSLLWAPEGPTPAVGFVRWTLLLAVFALTAARTAGPGWVAGPLALAGAGTALLVLAVRFGLPVPAPVPTGMAFDAGTHGSFDHEVFAGAFLAVVGPVTLYAAANARGSAGARWAYLLAALVVYLGLGVTGGAATALGVAGLLTGLALSFGRLKGSRSGLGVWGATMVAVVLAVLGHFAIGGVPPAEPQEEVPNLAPSLYETIRLDPGENAVTSEREWRFAWAEAAGVFDDAVLLGEGVGAFPYYAGFSVDTESPYYTEPRPEYHTHSSPPGVVAGLMAEQGVVGLVLGLLFFVLAIGSGVVGAVRAEESQAPGAGYLLAGVASAIVVAALTPAVYHAGEGVAVMAVLGLATRLEGAGTGGRLVGVREVAAVRGAFGRFERWVLLGAPLLALLVFGAWSAARATGTDFLRQRGELYLMARQTEDAIASFEEAATLEPDDYLSQYYLGLTRYYTPTDATRLDAARENLTQAATLWPYDVRVQTQALKNELREGGEDPVDRMDAAATVRNRLLELRRRDPRNLEVHLQLADTQRALGDNDQAVAALIAATELTSDPMVLSQTHAQLGDLFSDELDDPDAALEHYRLAMETAMPRSPLADRVTQRIGFVEEWIRRGSRPAGDSSGHAHPGEGPGAHEGPSGASEGTGRPAGGAEGTGGGRGTGEPAPAGQGEGSSAGGAP